MSEADLTMRGHLTVIKNPRRLVLKKTGFLRG